MTPEKQNNNNAMLIHLSPLIKYVFPFPFVTIIMPLIFWQSLRKDDDFVDQHGKEAVNFNLSFLLYNFILTLITLGGFGAILYNSIKLEQFESDANVLHILFSTGGFVFLISLFLILGLIKVILMIIAAIKSSQGELYRYPLTIRFIK